MTLDERQFKDLNKPIEKTIHKQKLSQEDVEKFIQLKNIDECKQYMKVMLDFYFNAIDWPSNYIATSEYEDDRNIWLQTMFSKGCSFLLLLDGISYSTEFCRLNIIMDFPTLFTVARRIYESLIAFELIFVIPKSLDQQTIIHNLFIAHSLQERLRNSDEEFRKENPERIKEEEQAVDECKRAIEETGLYKTLNKETKQLIDNAFGRKFRYTFKEDNTMEPIQYNQAHTLLNVKEGVFDAIYSQFSLHGHPSYLSLIQFRDAFEEDGDREDVVNAIFVTRCVLSFMSIFILDYMKINPLSKDLYDRLEEPRKLAIKFFGNVMRGLSLID